VKSFKDEFDRWGVVIVVISFAEPERLAPYQEHHHWPFVMLADPKRIAYQAFALKRLSWFRVFSPSTLRLYFRLLREGKQLKSSLRRPSMTVRIITLWCSVFAKARTGPAYLIESVFNC